MKIETISIIKEKINNLYMQHAILITAYKNFEQLTDLVEAFAASNFKCYIHIDKKAPFSKEELKSLSDKENVSFVVRHYNVYWGGSNHLRAILQLLDEAYKNPENQYFHLITGQDYPIKSLEEIDAFYKEHKGKEFLEYNKLPYHKWAHGGYERLVYYNFCDTFNGKSLFGQFMIRTLITLQKIFFIKRAFDKDFPPLYGGSTYWSLSRECITYIKNYLDEKPQYLKRFDYSFCAEELFFQTLILNSPLKENVINDPMRYIVWEKRNGNFPANLDVSDEKAMWESNALFARKFEIPVSTPLLMNIKKRIRK